MGLRRWWPGVWSLFSRRPVTRAHEPAWLPAPDVDAVPDDAESDVELPPEILDALKSYARPPVATVPETLMPLASVIADGPRFQVIRQHEGVTYRAYGGASGGDARRAWEAYQASELKGQFVFVDLHSPAGHRGMFARE